MDDRHRPAALTAGAPPQRRTRRRTTGGLCAALCLALVALPTVPAAAEVTDPDPSFEVSDGDLRFILKQIKISEAHPYDGDLLCESPTDTTGTCVPDPKLPWGLRTVSGIYNNLNPARADYGAADRPFPRLMPDYMWPGRGAGSGSFDVDGPGPAPAAQVTSAGYDDSDVVDGHPRTVSNLVVDQTDSNPAAVAAAGAVPGSSVDEATGEIFIPNESPDEGLSAPFNSWMTLFGQFFDHGLDLVNKGGNGTVYIPLNDDDPLVVGDPADPADDLPAGLRFMPLTRATVVGSAPNGARLHNNQTTPFVDQNQTYTSHPAHQVFLREYETSSGSAAEHGPPPRRRPGRPGLLGRAQDGHRGDPRHRARRHGRAQRPAGADRPLRPVRPGSERLPAAGLHGGRGTGGRDLRAG